MGDFQNFKFEDTIPELCPETQLNFRKFLQAAGIENMLINDGRRISDTEVLDELRKEVAMLSRNENDEHAPSLIPACINGDDEAVRALLPSGEYDVNEVAPDGETALTCAVSANALRIVEMLLKHGADPNFRSKKVECTPLMEAASVGYTDIVRLLLQYGACVGQKSTTGNTALHYAATAGHLECVCLLLQYNSPMEVQNETGHTPLMEATSNGHIDVARCLIKHGADINTHSTEFKESALTLASYKGHTEMVRFLLEAGADHEHRTDEMHTALMEAAMEGHVEVARLLLAHGANVNIPQDSFESPLTLAACGGHTELAHLLIGYGADIEEVNDEGYTPLMEAAREGHEETVALLLAVGADVNARTEETQETALTLAACGGFIEVCEMLLNAEADIEVGGVGCSTPLMEAAQEGHIELVKRLLQRGAAVNAITATGDTALHYAAENGHVKVCKELLDWGAVFGAMTEGGKTPLMKAARNGNLEVVQLFVEHGAAIDQPTSQNDANALSLACSGGHAKVVKYLLQHGADPQYQLRDGSTMLIEAARSGNPAVLRLILDYPKCLTQPSAIIPSSVQLLGNAMSQQQQLQLIQPLVNGVPSPSAMPPPPPLPMSISSPTTVDTCMDPTHAHLHAHQQTISCPTQHTHQSLSFQSPAPSLVASANSVQAQTHLDAALVSAYAVGWADGAALAQQHHVLPPSVPGDIACTASVLCSTTSTLISNPPESFNLLSNTTGLDALSASQALAGKIPTCSTVIQAPGVDALSGNFPNHPGAMCNSNSKPTSADVSTIQAVLTEVPSETMAAVSSSVTTNSTSSMSGSSSASSGSSASSLVTGASVDLTDDIGAGLLALFQELMPDKDELIRRFEAAMCPYHALRLARPALTQQQQQSGVCASTTPGAVAMTTNAAAIALSRLVDQQQQARQRSTVSENVTSLKMLPQSNQISQTPIVELLSKAARDDDCGAVGDQISEKVLTQTAGISVGRATLDQPNAMEPVILSSDTTPVLSSCHSSSSALSTSECCISSSVSAADSICLPNKVITSSVEPTSPFSSYDYDVNRTADISASSINSAYLGNMNNKAALVGTQGIFHESGISHDMLTYRNYSHPGSHIACALDATATAAAVASLGHPNVHAPLHHHHSLAVSAGGDPLITPSGLLHVPHQGSAIPVDTLIGNPGGTLAYDPASALAVNQHAIQSASQANGARVLPMGPPAVLNSSGAPVPPAHLLAPNNVGSAATNSLPEITEPVTPVNVQSVIDVNACIESSMETALTLACSGGYVELVQLLLERGADREHRDKKSNTPLHTAVYANQRAVVALLLDYGAEIEAQVDRTKDTALSIACSHGRLEIVEELLNRGANKEHRNISDYTPLSLAASGGYVEVIQLLLRHGAEINSRTGSKLGISPLMLASMNGHTNAVRLLLEHGSDINAHIETNRNTALTLACFQGRHEVVNLLVERKANIEHRAKTGLTPLMEAASGDYVEVGMILLEHGADVNAAPVPSSRDTALTIAADKGNAKFVNLLLEKGAVVEARNKKGATPLWLASNGGHLEVVQSLIRYNADVNSQDNRKVSCLMAAFRKGHINVVRLLVQYVTQFPSDKDCIRHIKTAVTDKELAKRCQQCRETIIAAKEKQEGEARKNANCLLEQIKQEEEERANREAMQARKRERKRMKRKAKQEKERKGKESNVPSSPVHSSQRNDVDEHTISSTQHTSSAQDNATESSPERRSPLLDTDAAHARKASVSSQRSSDSTPDAAFDQDSTAHQTSVLESAMKLPDSIQSFSRSADSSIPSPSVHPTDVERLIPKTPHQTSTGSQPDMKLSSPSLSGLSRTQQTNLDASREKVNSISDEITRPETTTEARREKHRNKKQSQRAAKRAAVENNTSNANKISDSTSGTASFDASLPTLPASSAYYAVAADGDGEMNWNALIESQNCHLGQYLTSTLGATTTTETNTWTVVLPSNSARTQRSANTVNSGSKSSHEGTDWKTTSSSSGSSRRRLSIPVSRHDIGKVIGQGGAVVSALRNMSGIQIDIESARSDEVTERMVYLKGPGEAVQRTYETIQGLLNGSIAGNDVLLMYATLKKSTSSAGSTLGKNLLGALNSKANGAITLTSSGTSKVSVGSRSTGGKSRRSGKSSTAASATSAGGSARSASTNPSAHLFLNRTSGLDATLASSVPTSSNNNNNSTAMCSTGILSSTAAISSTIMSTKTAASNWNSKMVSVGNGTSAKGNFASVAAAGLSAQPARLVGKVTENTNGKINHSSGKYVTVPNLMSGFPSVTPTTAPVSLLSLNVTPFSTSSQMFPDLAMSFSTPNDVAPDSLDEVSFPPLNSKATRNPSAPVTGEEKDIGFSSIPSTQPPTNNEATMNPVDEAVGQVLDNAAIEKTVTSEVPEQSSIDTVVCTSTAGSEPIAVSTSPSIFKPLTVSPPVLSGTQASQPATPAGSGGSHSATCVCTPPTTGTQTKPFARAPGSERSAHQRNANISTGPPSVSLGDTFPPSLMSLDVGVNLNCTGRTSVDDALLLTPTKRAVSPRSHDLEFRQNANPACFDPEHSPEWHESNPVVTTAPQSNAGAVFPKTYPLDSASRTDLPPACTKSLHHSLLTSVPLASVAGGDVAKSQVRGSSDALRSPSVVPNSWPMQPTDLNPDAVAFQPSSFQSSNSSLTHQISAPSTVANSTVPLPSSALIRTDYSELQNSDSLAGAYALNATVTDGLRQVTSSASLKVNTSGLPPSLQQPSTLSNLNSVGVSSIGLIASTFAQNMPITATPRPKPLLPVTPNIYMEPRSTMFNGFSSSVSANQSVQSPSPSTLLSGSHFQSMYPAAQQQHQQAVLGSGGFSNSLSTQQAVSGSRLGGSSPHTLLNQAQLPSYTPPPYMTGFMQAGVTGSGTNPAGAHPTANFSAHLINGAGPSVPVLGSGALLNASTTNNLHQTTSVPQVPIQPIGAERRRQTAGAMTSSVATPSVVYPPTTNNGAGPTSFGLTGINNHASTLQPQTPSPQQSVATSNANNLLMALTMNWVQQQQQQQQQQHMGISGTTSSHSPATWQSSSVWPANSAASTFPTLNGGSVGYPSSKPPSGLSDLGLYNSTNMISSGLSASNGSAGGQQHQQSMVAAAMAAMASMYPWNSGTGSNPNVVNPASAGSISTPGQNRWMYSPQATSTYPTTNPPPQAFFPDQLPPSLKPAGSALHSASSQPIHRPSHE
ncbi:unnamed protein product [Calicophoron daubneyi]|uniref:K Homology domain-containing protein n=1 Tax=Calicophoron daubneyi TaxID=300641 RepID=A0AAV2TT95_CALDB